MFILRETFCAESNSESFCIKITLGSFRIKITTCRMGCVSISGDPCAITNYCMNSYLVLQVTRAYIQQTAFSLCFQRSWLVETGLGLTDSRFWLVGSCQGLVVLHWSGYCTQVLGTPQCLFMCRVSWGCSIKSSIAKGVSEQSAAPVAFKWSFHEQPFMSSCLRAFRYELVVYTSVHSLSCQ